MIGVSPVSSVDLHVGRPLSAGEIRDLLAREYLAKTDLTVADIAHLLDYSETVNFRRAFVRWNGVRPSDYRQQQAV